MNRICISFLGCVAECFSCHLGCTSHLSQTEAEPLWVNMLLGRALMNQSHLHATVGLLLAHLGGEDSSYATEPGNKLGWKKIIMKNMSLCALWFPLLAPSFLQDSVVISRTSDIQHTCPFLCNQSPPSFLLSRSCFWSDKQTSIKHLQLKYILQ